MQKLHQSLRTDAKVYEHGSIILIMTEGMLLNQVQGTKASDMPYIRFSIIRKIPSYPRIIEDQQIYPIRQWRGVEKKNHFQLQRLVLFVQT
jgi:hypothetical protein